MLYRVQKAYQSLILIVRCTFAAQRVANPPSVVVSLQNRLPPGRRGSIECIA